MNDWHYEAANSASGMSGSEFAGCKWKLIRALLKDHKLSDGAVRMGVLLVCKYMWRSEEYDHHVEAYPGLEKLSNELGVCFRTCQRRAKELSSSEYFEVDGEVHRGKALSFAVHWGEWT